MRKILRHAKSRRFVRFLAVGVLNTAFGYGVFALLVIAGLNSGLALAIATMAGVFFNYFTTGRFVFANRGHALLPRFALAYAFSYGINLGLLKLFEHAGLPSLAAQAICLPLIVVLSFVLLRLFVFGPRNPP